MKKLSVLFILVLSIWVGGCGQQLAKDTPTQRNTNAVSLERTYQKVTHNNCAHQVTSSGIETVGAPVKWVQVAPNDPRSVVKATFVNSRNGSAAAMISDNSRFQVDYSFGALNMHVDSGINVVNYKFFSAADKVQEEGTVTLNVSYSEKTLDGNLDVDDCPPPPTPTH